MAWMAPMMAAESERRRNEDERLLAALVQQDTAQRYEFKILRGGPGAFRGQERLQRVLDEEAPSQWELAMKVDDASIALRRPRDARSRDAFRQGGIDPYRTELGSSRAAALVLVVLGLLLAVLFAGVLVARQLELSSGFDVKWVAITIAALMVMVLAVVVKVAIRRR